MPSLNSRAAKENKESEFPKLSLEWVYGISYTSTPIIQFSTHNPKLECRSLIYIAGVAVIIYNFFSHEQRYYLQHKVL